MHKMIVFGIQRSGTNYLEYMLKRVFKETGILYYDHGDYYWKHFVQEDQILDKYVKHVAVVKNPYLWVKSLKRYSADISISYGRTKHKMPRSATVVNDSAGATVYLESALELYKTIYSNWKNNEQVYMVQYEKVLDPKTRTRQFELLGNFFGLKVATDPLEINPKKVDQTDNWTKKRMQSYINQDKASISLQEIGLVNQILGIDFIKDLGYNVIL